MIIYIPNDRFEAKQLLLIPTIAPVVDGLLPVRISNWSTSRQRIYSGTKLGHIEIYNGKAAEQNCSIMAEQITPTETNSTHVPSPLKGKVYGELKVTTPSLSYNQQRMFSTLLNRYAYVFAKHEFDIGTSTIMKHAIQLKENKPIKQRAYRTPHKLIEESDR